MLLPARGRALARSAASTVSLPRLPRLPRLPGRARSARPAALLGVAAGLVGLVGLTGCGDGCIERGGAPEPGANPALVAENLLPEADRKSTRLNSSHNPASRMPSSA
jgi:hypothetical protein